MDEFGGPAALGGVMTALMLGAWMLGRWQGGLDPARRPREPVTERVPVPQELSRALGDAAGESGRVPDGRQDARDDRRAVFDNDVSLGELHADITAYRHSQRVLAGADVGTLRLYWSVADASEASRTLGIGGQPTCPTPRGTDADCACGTCQPEPAAALIRAVQPSFEAPFTRV
jgi:hypothetical protein